MFLSLTVMQQNVIIRELFSTRNDKDKHIIYEEYSHDNRLCKGKNGEFFAQITKKQTNMLLFIFFVILISGIYFRYSFWTPNLSLFTLNAECDLFIFTCLLFNLFMRERSH